MLHMTEVYDKCYDDKIEVKKMRLMKSDNRRRHLGRRGVSLLICLYMVTGLLPAFTLPVTAAQASWNMDSGTLNATDGNTYHISGGNVTGNNAINIDVADKATVTLVFTGDTAIDKTGAIGANARSAITIGSGANVTIRVNPGVTVTLKGSHALANTAGFAGINVPSGASLMLYGPGTLNAYGGNASNGIHANGQNGGYGGGGAGAGIGGNGGNGAGYSGVTTTGGGGKPGSQGNSGQTSGNVYVLTSKGLNCYGGNGGDGGDGSGLSGAGGGGYPASGIGGGGGGAGSGGDGCGGGGFSGGCDERGGLAGVNGYGANGIQYGSGGGYLSAGAGTNGGARYGGGGTGSGNLRGGDGGNGGASTGIYVITGFSGTVQNGTAANGSVVPTRNQVKQGYGGGYGLLEGEQGTVNLNYGIPLDLGTLTQDLIIDDTTNDGIPYLLYGETYQYNVQIAENTTTIVIFNDATIDMRATGKSALDNKSHMAA